MIIQKKDWGIYSEEYWEKHLLDLGFDPYNKIDPDKIPVRLKELKSIYGRYVMKNGIMISIYHNHSLMEVYICIDSVDTNCMLLINDQFRICNSNFDKPLSLEEGLDELKTVLKCIVNPIYVPLIVNTKWATPIVEYLLKLDG